MAVVRRLEVAFSPSSHIGKDLETGDSNEGPYHLRKNSRLKAKFSQERETVLHRISKHPEESLKYDAQRSIFEKLRGVSKCGVLSA